MRFFSFEWVATRMSVAIHVPWCSKGFLPLAGRGQAEFVHSSFLYLFVTTVGHVVIFSVMASRGESHALLFHGALERKNVHSHLPW